jgi:signal transduction histidine kinase
MALPSTLVTVALKLAAVTLLGQATWRTAQSRDHPNADLFLALLGTLTLWALAVLGAELPPVAPGDIVSFLSSVGQIIALVLLPGFWVLYARSYTGRSSGSTKRRVALFGTILLPLVFGLYIIASRPPERVMARRLAPLVAMSLTTLFGLFLYGTYVMFSFGGDHPRVSNTQVAVVTGGVTVPYLASIAIDTSEPVGGASVGLFLAGGLLTVALRRYPVTTGFPKNDYVARTRVVETLQEAVVVLDWDAHVLDLNEAAVELFGRQASDVVGEPLRTVVDGIGDADLTVGSTGTASLRTTKGRRQFQFSVSAVTRSGTESDPVARTVLLRDVTGRRTRQQRLSVLNRILRHNVRNDLDAVLAHTKRIEDDDVRTSIATIVDKTVRLSAKAREAEEVMTAVTEPPAQVDLADVAKSVADRFRSDGYTGTITVDTTDLQILSHRTVVRRVLYELVENAFEHADSDSPTVDITVRPGPDGTAELVVTDDGPGLPDREREILSAGTETQLKHGRGIGLWFVRWAVTQLGGELEFERNDPTGSIVTVRLYETVA